MVVSIGVIVELFKKGTWYKEYSQSTEQNKVIHHFIDAFVRDMMVHSLEIVFSQYYDEAKRISALVKPIVKDKQLSEKWFPVLFCDLVLSSAREKGVEDDMYKKIGKIFSLRGDDVSKYAHFVPKKSEYLEPVFFGNDSVELACIALDPFKKGNVYLSSRGVRWDLIHYDRGIEVSIVRMMNDSGRKKSFRDCDVLKMERVFGK